MPHSINPLATAAELAPLLSALRSGAPVDEPTYFPRGCLLPDGRLDLCKQDLGPIQARAVAQALEACAFVKSLLLGADHLEDEGARAIAGLLERSAHLETVFVGCNLIGSAGAEALAGASAMQPHLRGLWLKRNAIGERGAQAVLRLIAESPALRTLDLVDTGWPAERVSALAEAISRSAALERLYLGTNALHDGAAIAALIAAGRLRALYAGSQPLGDDGARAIAAALRDDRRLEVLELPSAGIGDAGVVALAEAAQAQGSLQVLALGRAPAAPLLGLAANGVGSQGVRALAALIRSSTVLRTLDLRVGGLPRAELEVLVDAVESSPSLGALELDGVPPELRARLDALLARNRAHAPPVPVVEDVQAIRSVYRTHRPARAHRSVREPRRTASAVEAAPTAPTPEAPLPSPAEIAAATRVLERLAASPEAFFTARSALAPLRAAANRVVSGIVATARARRDAHPAARRDDGDRGREQRTQDRAHDRALLERTGLRQQRAAATAPAPEPSERLVDARACYVCKARYRDVHAFYDGLCRTCGDAHYARRSATADLSGRTALLTGGRLKIGRQIALKLLRAGARVYATTRFPRDAAQRFAREPDFADWEDRLHLVGIDLRHLPSVERLAAELAERPGGVDILVNNAAQTVRRPPDFYAHLAAGEAQALPPALEALLLTPTALPTSAIAAPLADPALFPLGAREDDGQQLDLRDVNSWRLSVGEVSTLELLEVHVVNSLAPFILLRGLLPALERSPHPRRFVVNVSAMEGSFARAYKAETHPHTNMAKASLNMLTRTAAGGLAARNIYMTSVDTGWITNEQPHPVRERMKTERGFTPPLDEIDGAARVCDPIFRGVTDATPLSGVFLKDYRPIAW